MDIILTATAVIFALLVGIGIGRWSRNDLVKQVEDLRASLVREQEIKTGQGDLELLLKPLKDELERLREQAKSQREDEVRTEALIQGDLSQLRKHSEVLAKALGGNSVRGTYGEGQLEGLLEAAGLINGVHYETQKSVTSDNGVSRPDVTIKLPNNQAVQVDSKFPFDAYWKFIECEDPELRAELLKRHQKAVRDRIKELNAKKYADLTEGPNIVILFFPFESIWHAAIESDQGLVQYAADNRVVLTTPTTLLGVLRTIHYAWQRNQLAENASKIGTAADNLLRSVSTLVEDLNKLGNQLNTVNKTYNAFVSRFDSSFVTSAKRLQELTSMVDANLETSDRETIEARDFRGKAAEIANPNPETEVL